MKKNVTKILWGTFLVVIGLLWICTSTGLIESRTFSGLLFAFILVLIGVSIIFKEPRQEKKDSKSANNSGYTSRKPKSAGFSKEDSYEDSFKQTDYETGYQHNSYESDFGQSSNENGFSHNSAESDYDQSNQSTSGQNSDEKEFGYNGYETEKEPEYGFRQSMKRITGKEHYSSILSSQTVIFTEEFMGAEILALAGVIELDLRNAVITRDIVVDVSCIMGGITIVLPSNVMVSISCTPIMGGVESKIDGNYNKKDSKVTVYIRGTCFMGGIEIR